MVHVCTSMSLTSEGGNVSVIVPSKVLDQHSWGGVEVSDAYGKEE